MVHSFERAGRTLFAAMMIVLGVSCTIGIAGDDDDLAEDAPKIRDQNRRHMNAAEVSANLDGWIYGNHNFQSEEPRQVLDSLLTRKVEQIARTAGITEAYQQKLLLAGKGDIRRFFDKVDQIKAKFRSGAAEADVVNRAFQETRPMRSAFEGELFTGDSLFAKTLRKMLTPDQFSRYESIELDRRRFQHRAGVHMTVLRLATALGLSDDQWKQLEQLLLKETRPARIPGRPYPAAYFNIVYVQMGRLPEEKLKPLFEPWQWDALKSKLAQATRFARGLQANGIRFDGDQNPLPVPQLGPGEAAGIELN